MDAVTTRDLTKVYNGKTKISALNGLNLTIHRGELFTLLGRNGAGKTTFLRIISTQLMPTGGYAEVLGFNVVTEPDSIRKIISIIPQDVATNQTFTPFDYCYYFAQLRGKSRRAAVDDSEEALKVVGLWELRDRPCFTLSGGEKRRTLIASSLTSDAEVMMLDEPTSGLDAFARRKVWAVLRDFVDGGKTIILTTHMMEEAEVLSDRLAIVDGGTVRSEGTLEALKAQVDEKYRVILDGDLSSLSQNWNRYVKVGGKHFTYFKDENNAVELVREALKKSVKAEISPITLEDIFVKTVGDGEE